MKQKKTLQIEELLNNIFFLDSKQMADILLAFKKMPKSALDDLIIVLNQSLRNQTELISKIQKRDPGFLRKLGIFVDDSTNSFLEESLLRQI